jgi:hypothetical protein
MSTATEETDSVEASRHLTKAPFLFRIWYYVRTGYGTYLSFALGFFNTSVLAYYLLVERVPFLKEVFPFFTLFLATIFLGLGIASVLLGWIHFGRIPAFKAEMDISTEANPYYYKPTPGIYKELLMPTYCYAVRALEIFLDTSHKMTDEDRAKLRRIYDQLEMLSKGGSL